MNEVPPVFLHHLLSSQVDVQPGFRLGRVLGGRRRLLGGVFTRQVAHLARQCWPGVDKGAELANPLWQRPNRVRAEDDTVLTEAARRHTNLSVRVRRRRSEAGKLGRHRRASSQAGSLTHLAEDAAALIHDGAALTLPL